MKKINIGGVPEHFNLAWYLTLKDGEYKNKGINLRWHDYHGGTGAMCKALRNKEIDIAVILTEGIIKDIIAGNQCKIVQVFVKSSLIWGVHVAHNSNYNSIEDVKGKKEMRKGKDEEKIKTIGKNERVDNKKRKEQVKERTKKRKEGKKD